MEARLSGQKQRMTHLLEFSCAEEVLLLLQEKHRGHFDRCLRLQHELRRALPARGEVGARGGVARRRRRDWRAARRKMLRVRDSGVKAERAGGERLHDEWNRRQRAIVHVRDRNRRRARSRAPRLYGPASRRLCHARSPLLNSIQRAPGTQHHLYYSPPPPYQSSPHRPIRSKSSQAAARSP